MKNRLLLVIFCLYACAVRVTASEQTRYVEFARAYGVIRYFSPNPYTHKWSEADWMKVCALLAHRAETQPLATVFDPLASALVFSDRPMSVQNEAPSADANARYYSYSGSGDLNIPLAAKLFIPGLADYVPYYKRYSCVSDSRDSLPTPVAGRYYSYRLSDDVYLSLRHALPREAFDGAATRRLLSDAVKYWDNHRSDDKTLSKRRSFIFGLLSDKAVRVADITVRWNIVRHFYPYYEDDGLDWDRRLETFMQEVISMEQIDTYEALLEWRDTICRFLNPVKDGHMFVRRDMKISGMQSTYLPEFYAAAEVKSVNDTLLVRTVVDFVRSWRILRTINGRPASERMDYCRSVTNAATAWHRDILAAREMLSSPVYGMPVVIGSSDTDGRMYVDTLQAVCPEAAVTERKQPPVKRLGNGILYVDATSPDLNEKLFLSAVTPDIRGLCFDLRGLPSIRFESVLAHMITSDVAAPATEVPINRFPFQQGVAWRIGNEMLEAKLPHVALPAIFLCDAGTVSWGETILLMVRHYGLGTIVGQPTAGTTGDMTHFDLPMFPFSMTGMRMHGMDGERHHAVGVVPDIIVSLHADDCMAGYDRTLHTALRMME